MKTCSFVCSECEARGDVSNYADMVSHFGTLVSAELVGSRGRIVAKIDERQLPYLQEHELFGFCDAMREVK